MAEVRWEIVISSHPRLILYNLSYLESNYSKKSENIPGKEEPIDRNIQTGRGRARPISGSMPQPAHYVGLMDAVSLGTYLHRYVKGSYRYQKLG
jgi:hypothetical protein